MYPIAIRLAGRTHYLLYESDDEAKDRVWTRPDGLLLSFATFFELVSYTAAERIDLDDARRPDVLDLDVDLRWLSGGEMPDLDLLMDVWILSGDVARGLNQEWNDTDPDVDHVYDLLFYGLNLPAITPTGEHFTPEWTESQLDLLRGIIGQGISMMQQSLDL